MSLERTGVVEQNFLNRLKNNQLPVLRPFSLAKVGVSAKQARQLFDSQMTSRLLDGLARRLKEQGEAFYTIGSSGHEGNAVLGQVFSLNDMAFLHYRSGAFFIERAKQSAEVDGVEAVLLSLMASSDCPISGGRHKVFGSVPLSIPPQTSTIASHLPKALGAAMSIRRAKELGIERKLADDSVILASLGDASLNHASTQTTLNACGYLVKNQYPLPLIFICEDNGIGISTATPKNWVKESVQDRVGLHYIEANGLDIADTYRASREAAFFAREKKQPVFLHLSCVRLCGHAGSDIETQYLTEACIMATEAHCPLLYTAARMLEWGLMTTTEIALRYDELKQAIETTASHCRARSKLSSAEAVMHSIVPTMRRVTPYPLPSEVERKTFFGAKFKQWSMPRSLQQLINLALGDLLLQFPHLIIFGEDVARKGGVYRVTADLQQQFGSRRVFDTLLDETTILGTAIGLAHNGFVPMVEIQFLAYLHNAIDQVRGEAATLSFFSNGQYANPMIIRIPSLAYQRGFGGHFHNDNSFAALRDIPGLIIACPSNGRSAVRVLRRCMQLAHTEGRVVVFMEPIALYMTKDLFKEGDGLWLNHYPALDEVAPLDEVVSVGEGELAIISYANGFYLSRKAQHILALAHGLAVKVIDLQWLKPLPMRALIKAIGNVTKVLVVDEGRMTGSLSEEVVTRLYEEMSTQVVYQRLCARDCFIPLGDAWQYVLPSTESIVEATLRLHQDT